MRNGKPDVDLLGTVITSYLGSQADSSTIGSDLGRIRLEKLARLLYYRLAKFADHTKKRNCLKIIKELPEDGILSLLRSPAMCEALRCRMSEETLETLILSELELHNSNTLRSREVWSSLGNIWLGSRPPCIDVSLECRNGAFYGPELTCGVPFDLSLPDFLQHPTAGLKAPRRLSDQEMLDARMSLDAAVEVLKFASPLAFDVLIGLTSNIVVRCEDTRRGETWGASSGVAIGRMVIVNVDAVGDIEDLTAHVLHEVVHIALDCAELAQPLFPEISCATKLVESPWTGNRINLHAFAHAVVVWATLLAYWRKISETVPDSTKANVRCDSLSKPFRQISKMPYVELLRAANANRAAELISNTWKSAALMT